jgi:hypothetical protein
MNMAENEESQDRGISPRARYILAMVLICSAVLLGTVAPV